MPLSVTETSFLSLITSSNTLRRMQIYRAIPLSIVCANNDVFEGLTSRLEVTSDLAPDALDLLQDVIAAGERNRYHQDHRGGADHHPQPGEQRTNRIGAQRLRAETERFAEKHGAAYLPAWRSSRRASDRGGSSGVSCAFK